MGTVVVRPPPERGQKGVFGRDKEIDYAIFTTVIGELVDDRRTER